MMMEYLFTFYSSFGWSFEALNRRVTQQPGRIGTQQDQV